MVTDPSPPADFRLPCFRTALAFGLAANGSICHPSTVVAQPVDNASRRPTVHPLKLALCTMRRYRTFKFDRTALPFNGAPGSPATFKRAVWRSQDGQRGLNSSM
ncbi:hypothetical protein GSI_11204 [Ganoderma sinense ZZ0214-1]|uniref:Uncharacterized protein n=1 Tax=Ganoderma sinense ZZ0214-1 TaxID=1077348 RepID=A0A2G8RYY2_9APHY|nr:hypothetical protein GSI_11202 [Ganoderma sinense ZZ0214-1]PIL26725.1 hypothetical protein GSI_11204 [Ganoderma sinense ZZ0214-1]